MSITSALSSALTGISATSRQAEILSSNIANATTPGYARREVLLSARELGGTGQGVQVTGVARDTDQYLINERRSAQAGDADRGVRSEFLRSVEGAIGTPETAGSIGARIAAFDQALIEAASRPNAEARLATVGHAARALASGLNTATDAVQQARATADRQIATEIESVNTALRQVHELNTQLRSFSGAGHDVSAILDQRQQVIDSIAAIVSLREVPRGQNQIALFTTGGATLLDGVPSELSFSAANTIIPESSVSAGGLSGLKINGNSVATTGQASPVLGGKLAALFSVRDELAVEAQGKLDALARDLVERFSQSSLDPTIAPGNPGLFTDQGAAFLPADEVGLAGRIGLNATVDTSQGGAVYRFRDGLYAAAPGPAGEARLLNGLQQALTRSRPLSSSAFTAGSRSLSGLAADLLSDISARRLSADSETSFASARLAALSGLEAEGGVDTDQEMQMLLVIEKNYAANAKVIQTMNDMLDTLLGL
jgi:flagellar hook-associated protein 1